MRLVLTLALAFVPARLFALPLSARIVARLPDGSVTTAPVQARVHEPVALTVVLLRGRTLLADAPRVVLDGRARIPTGPLPPGVRVAWQRIEPRRQHVDHPSPNPDTASFSNSVLFGPRHGRWLGYDTLEYTQGRFDGGPDAQVDNAVLTLTAAHPSDATQDTHGGAGSSWYAAIVTLADGSSASTPDRTAVDRLGLLPTVMRVSFRSDDSYAGWLSTYFHVTSVFGSNGPTAATHQSDRYTGADCADVLVGAMRASGRRELAYGAVASIRDDAFARSAVLRIDEHGLRDASGAAVTLRWGHELAPGDLVTIDYADDPGAALPRDWDHIGALVADDGDGVLSPGDTLRHMGPAGLEDTPLVHAGPMRVVLWRWRTSTTAPGARRRRETPTTSLLGARR